MWKNLARVAAEEQNGPGLWAFAGESGPDSIDENCLLRSSLHQYKNNQQPIVLKRQLSVSSRDIYARPRAVILSFGFNRGHVTRK